MGEKLHKYIILSVQVLSLSVKFTLTLYQKKNNKAIIINIYIFIPPKKTGQKEVL